MTTPANPDDLTAFLRAIYDERERTALAAGGRGDTGQWHAPDRVWAGMVEDADGNIVVYDEGSPTEAQAAHIAEHDPATELAEVDAKRRILDRCAEAIGDRDLSGYDRFGSLADEPNALALFLAVETMRDLALPFADREGFREEWRPA